MNVDMQIKTALDELATSPEPAELAEKALRQAARRRGYRLAYGSATGLGVLALAAVGATQLWFAGPPTPVTPGGRPSAAPCVQYTSGSNGLPDVPRDEWPDFVTAVVDALPDRSDYSMQSGSGWCRYESAGLPALAGRAYAVINIGQNREGGHLTIDMTIGSPDVPRDCSEVGENLLFCGEPTGEAPLTIGQGSDADGAMVTAIYADGTVIRMESHAPEVTADDLLSAVTNLNVYRTVPLEAGTPT
jgi:hypothetical protein